MIGKIIGAIAGSQAARHFRGIDGTGGALLGAVAPTLLRRLGPMGLIAIAAGGYAYKKHRESGAVGRPQLSQSSTPAEPTRTQA